MPPSLLVTDAPATFAQIAARCGVNHSTVRRWVKDGVTVGGVRVRLAAVRLGGSYRVLPEALARFEAACNPEPVPLVTRTPAQRQRDSERAGKAAKKAFGLK